jgi:hypothetical protein
MLNPATPPEVKARMADSILDHAAKAIEIEDIEARVSELASLRSFPYKRFERALCRY